MKFTVVTVLSLAVVVATGCAVPKKRISGTVYKQEDGTYRAAYSAATEEKVRKTMHVDATNTCLNKFKAQEFIVVNEEIKKIEKDTQEGNVNKVINLAGKYLGAEGVTGTLTFKCDMDTVKKGFFG